MSREADFINNLHDERQRELDGSKGYSDLLKVVRKLLVEVYPQDAHFVYELLQNAEDVEATWVRFVLNEDQLQFVHNGRPFNNADVISLSNVAQSSKLIRTDADTRIGQFGVGFKSVYAYTNSPEIHSGNWHFRIKQLIVPEVSDEMDGTGVDYQHTVFVIPFDHDRKTKQNAFKEIKEELDNLHPRTVLFLRHIRKIEIEIGDSKSCVEMSQSINDLSGNHIQIAKNGIIVDYLRFVDDVPIAIEGDDGHIERKVPIGIAYLLEKVGEDAETGFPKYKIVKDDEAKVFVYFPAENEVSNLKFSINAAFAPTISRSNIRETRENLELIEAIAKLQVKKLDFLKESGFLTTEFLGVLPNANDVSLKISKYKIFYRHILEAFKQGAYLPTRSGEFRSAKQVLIGDSKIIEIVNEDNLRKITGLANVCWLKNASQRNTTREDAFLRNWELGIKTFGVRELLRDNYRSSVNQFLKFLENSKLAELYALIIDQDVVRNREQTHWRPKFEELKRDVNASCLIRLQNGHTVSLNDVNQKRVVWSECPCDVGDDILFVDPHFAQEMCREIESAMKMRSFFSLLLGVERYDEKSTLRYYIDNFNGAGLIDEDILKRNIDNICVLLRLLNSGKAQASEFRDFPVLVSDRTFRPLANVFIDDPYEKTGLNRIGAALNLAQKYALDGIYHKRLSECELKTFLAKIQELGGMIRLEIVKSNLIDNENPRRAWLLNAPGYRQSTQKEEDYVVLSLRNIIDSIANAEPNVAESIGELLWNLILSVKESQVQASYYKNDSQRNRGGERKSDSTFISLLKHGKWIRRRDGRIVEPKDASFMDIPVSWKWPLNKYNNIGLKAIGFSENKDNSDLQLEGAWDLLGLRNPDVIKGLKDFISETLEERGGDEQSLIDTLRQRYRRGGGNAGQSQSIVFGGNDSASTQNNQARASGTSDGKKKVKSEECLALDGRMQKYLNSLRDSKHLQSGCMIPSETSIYGVKEFLSLKLQIPNYQRPYEWNERNVVDLLDDICEAQRMGKTKYRIGSIILHNDKDGFCKIVDGQQRTLTLLLILCALSSSSDESWGGCNTDALRLLCDKDFFPALSQCKVSRRNLRNNLVHITNYFRAHSDAKEAVQKAIEDQLEVVVVGVKEQAEAFQLFDSQNSKGRPLEPHDLLKAFHLRLVPESPSSTEKPEKEPKEVMVEKWESHASIEIGRLFNEMLFRIYKWNRKEKSEKFTAQHIGIFKGIPMRQRCKDDKLPKAKEYGYVSRAEAAHDKFQIGEPIVPGEDFFTMVEYYFGLCQVIDQHVSKVKEVVWIEKKCNSKHLSPLFRAILLDYFDRFGFKDSEPVLAIKKLCKWAFMVRLDLKRLGPRTPNNYALGGDGNYSNKIPMFAMVKTAVEHTDVINVRLNNPSTNEIDDKNSELRKALEDLCETF